MPNIEASYSSGEMMGATFTLSAIATTPGQLADAPGPNTGPFENMFAEIFGNEDSSISLDQLIGSIQSYTTCFPNFEQGEKFSTGTILPAVMSIRFFDGRMLSRVGNRESYRARMAETFLTLNPTDTIYMQGRALMKKMIEEIRARKGSLQWSSRSTKLFHHGLF